MVGHVGDSRCYRLRGETLQQITRDHSLLQEQIDAGLLTPEQAQFATHKNLVTRALGVEDTVLLEVNEYRVEDGDTYLFCSDGLSDMVPDERLAAILQGEGSLEERGQRPGRCSQRPRRAGQYFGDTGACPFQTDPQRLVVAYARTGVVK